MLAALGVFLMAGCEPSAPAVPPPAVVAYQPLYMTASKTATVDGCNVMTYLYNALPKTLEVFSGDVTLNLKSGGTIKTYSFNFQYIDPGKNAAEHIRLDEYDCDKFDEVHLRNIAVCKIDGSYYKDCMDYVQVMDDSIGNILLK